MLVIILCLLTPVRSQEGLESREPGGYPRLSLGEQTSTANFEEGNEGEREGEEPSSHEKEPYIGKSSDDYILKTQIVPPVCPACPPACDRTKPCPPCPPCARCPEMPFRCEKVPIYSEMDPSYLPQPLVNRIL